MAPENTVIPLPLHQHLPSPSPRNRLWRGYYSADICVGSITREQALHKLETPAWADLNVNNDVAFVARKLDYQPKDLERFMDAPILWYKDFPHREKLLGLCYDAFRFLSGRRKASNF